MRTCIAAALLASLPTTSMGQSGGFDDFFAGAANPMIWDDIRASTPGAQPQGSDFDFLLMAATPSVLSADDLYFKPNAKLRSQTRAEFAEMITDDRPDLGTLFANNDLLSIVADAQSSYGVTDANMADTAAVLLFTMFKVANGEAIEPSPTAARGLRQQVASVVGTGLGSTVPSAEEVQSVSDKMMLQVALLLLLDGFAKQQGPAAQQELAATVREQGLTDFGLDFTAVELGDHGFQKK